MNITNMKIVELINYFKNLTYEEFIENKEFYSSLSLDKFNLLFLNANKKIKKHILDDNILFDKVMSIPKNKKNKMVIELVDEETQNYIFKNKNLSNSILGKQMLIEYFNKINYEKFSTLVNKYEFSFLKNELNVEKFNPSEYLSKLIISNKNYSSVYLFKIKNKYELFIYSKFNILIEIKYNKSNYIYLDDENYIDYNILININRKHVTNLIEMLKKKDKNCTNKELFITIIKLYTVFGYDNSKKIIEDFYSYSTDASITRASYELATDLRREFRIKNQNKYYYYGIEKEILLALEQNNREIFKNICMSEDDKYIDKFISKLQSKLTEEKDYEKKIEIIKSKILKEIKLREIDYIEKSASKYRNYYQNIARKKPLLTKELYFLLKKININCCLNKKGQVIENKDLTRFLLGNYKKNNDCLFRMILNKQALGLNNEIYNIINNFSKLQCINLSNTSLLDVIDFSKVLLYDLKPDEMDISLETLSKILNSRQFLYEPPEEIVKRVLKLHKKRKSKVYCSIPTLKGNINNINYEIPKFYDDSLLSLGIDGGDCLKVGGPGEEFLNHCLTDDNATVLFLYHNNIKYILPCVRTGNMININGISPKIKNEDTIRLIIDTIKKIGDIWVNDDNNSIEFVTISDINIKLPLSKMNFEKIKFEKFIPLNTTIYTDYMKKEVTNYILSKKSKKSKVNYNYPPEQEKFYQERNIPYIYDSSKDYDKERINILINSIAYSSIDYNYKKQEDIKYHKENYKPLDPSNFICIIGSNDWFIGINKLHDIITYLLPYDKRAATEYNKVLYNLKQNNYIKENTKTKLRKK